MICHREPSKANSNSRWGSKSEAIKSNSQSRIQSMSMKRTRMPAESGKEKVNKLQKRAEERIKRRRRKARERAKQIKGSKL